MKQSLPFVLAILLQISAFVGLWHSHERRTFLKTVKQLHFLQQLLKIVALLALLMSAVPVIAVLGWETGLIIWIGLGTLFAPFCLYVVALSKTAQLYLGVSSALAGFMLLVVYLVEIVI